MPSGGGTLRQRNRRLGWLFVSPWVIGFLAFSLYPFVASGFYSMTDYSILRPPEWIGFGNFQALVRDPLFWTTLYNTVYYTLFFVPLSTVVAICFALLLNVRMRGLGVYRTLFYLPSIVPVVASSAIWIWLFSPSSGLINSFLRLLGIPGPGWLFSETWVKPALILMGLWGIGQIVVIYLAALQDVPREQYESAEMEGANGLQRTLSITLPMISPAILFNVIMGLISSFQYFSQAYVMTQGGPGHASTFYALYLYQNAFQYLHMGYASAMAWLLLVLVLGATLFVFRTSARWVYYGSDR